MKKAFNFHDVGSAGKDSSQTPSANRPPQSGSKKDAKKAKNPGFIITEYYRQIWEALPDEDCGKLLKIMIAYHFDELNTPDLPLHLEIAAGILKKLSDGQKDEYQSKCEKNAENIKIRWNNK